ncbi:MAG: DUF4105 domain-containing protein [Moraxella sp.]|uniref:DUF7840 domain-containing protein n=1 Tax=Moraxella sp. TaxID=479 RepID=UPI0026DCE3DC|nr:DUF4105 domain-containing protein [Moraxella sp.]MDO4449807.1 DUF4105 domain-containing protein [Moraxella sp.]
MKKFNLCLALMVVFGSQIPAVLAHDGVSHLSMQTSEGKLHQLSQSTTWHRLLLYKNQKSSLPSHATNAKFFVSGKFDDPHAELIANIETLSNPATKDVFACQFPARTHWLISQLPHLSSDIHLDDCEEFNAFKSQIDVKQLSLIYAEEHINRVGSFFAHTLIKIDNTKSLATHNSDDAYYINFATDETADDSMIRTVQGKNPAAMTVDKFTEKQASYLMTDERDLWEFTIDLPQDELDQIIRHLWEVRGLHRYYNFLDNNCASEILRLIDVANDRHDLVKDAGKIISPNEVGRVLQRNHLLKSQNLQPSRRTMLAEGIDVDEQSYKQLMTDGNLPHINKPKNNPLLSSPVHRLHVDVQNSDFSDTAYMLGFRGAYQDLLDRNIGKRQFIHTNIAEINLAYDDKLKLQRATLIDFLAFNPKNAPLSKASYGGHVKLDRVSDRISNDNLVLSMGGAYGGSWQMGRDGLCYTLGTGTAQAGQVARGYRLGVGVQAGCAYHLNDKTRLHTELSLPIWYHDKAYLTPKISLGGQYDVSKTLGVRLLADYERIDDFDKKGVNIGIVRYFD